MKILKLLAINILSIISIPLFLIATLAKLCSKSLEKVIPITVAVLLFFGLVLLQWFSTDDNTIGIFFIMLFIFILVGMVFILLFTVAATLFYGGVKIAAAFFELIHNIFFKGSNTVLGKCDQIVNELAISRGKCIFTCPFYMLAKSIEQIILYIFSWAFNLAIIATIGVIVGTPLYFHLYTKHTFGLSLFKYMSMFATKDNVFSCIYVLIFIVSASLIILCLGAEWSEWGCEARSKV